MAYTKYSLTPANNNAAPPDGAPEGMLPSAVNDTMRDMMAQIRDCGDGIRGGTYTMTAPVITGGSINGAAIGASSASTGSFTTLAYSSTLTGGTGVVNLGSGQFYKDASGNIGVGTASPARSLDVRKAYTADTIVAQIGNINNGNGATPVATIFDFTEANGTSVSRISSIYTQSAGTTSLAFGTFSGGSLAEKMRIDSSGNVGIGTSSPSVKLQVQAATNPEFRVTNGTNTFQLYASTDSTIVMGSVDNIPVTFRTNATERMRIDSSGRLLIGQSSPFQVGGISFQPFGNGAGSSGNMVVNASGTSNFPNIFQYNGSDIGYITYSNTAVLYVSLSDYRAKENIASISNSGARIDALKPIEYDFKAGGRTRGFLAHEFAEVYPDSVVGEKDAVDAEGKPKHQAMQSSSAEVMADLIAEIQSLRKRVAQLESK